MSPNCFNTRFIARYVHNAVYVCVCDCFPSSRSTLHANYLSPTTSQNKTPHSFPVLFASLAQVSAPVYACVCTYVSLLLFSPDPTTPLQNALIKHKTMLEPYTSQIFMLEPYTYTSICKPFLRHLTPEPSRSCLPNRFSCWNLTGMSILGPVLDQNLQEATPGERPLDFLLQNDARAQNIVNSVRKWGSGSWAVLGGQNFRVLR